jgi:hypothetical protein
VSFLEAKLAMRRAVHSTFAASALYSDTQTASAVPLTVRWHSADAKAYGDIESVGYAEVLARVDRLVFSRDELTSAQIRLRRLGRVVFPDYGNAVFVLDTEDPPDGPITVAWTVSRPPQDGGSA